MLCETDVEVVEVFLVDPVDSFGRLARTICVLSVPRSPTMIVVSTLRDDCPRDRCLGNTDFGSFDATLNDFSLSLSLKFRRKSFAKKSKLDSWWFHSRNSKVCLSQMFVLVPSQQN